MNAVTTRFKWYALSLQDYHHETPQGLLDKIQSLLDGYKPKAKAKYLGIVCKVRHVFV